MKHKLFSLFVLVSLLVVGVIPAHAQLGTTDVSSFNIQNISGGVASVTVIFVKEDGTQITPNPLLGAPTNLSNPFNLNPNEMKQIYVPSVPGLAAGSYSVIVSSTAQVIAFASLTGSGSTNFTGTYSGFDSGNTTFYLASTSFNYYGWYSMLTVQNVGGNATPVDVTITCTNVNPPVAGTLHLNSLASMGSHTFVLKPGNSASVIPTGFTSGTVCNGSAVVTASEDVVAVDDQNVPAQGNTNSFNGVSGGNSTLYVPSLTNNYFGWVSSLTIQKLEAGDTQVTVKYSDTGQSVFTLTDATPSKQLYIPSVHPGTGLFGAKVTTNPAKALVGVTSNSIGRSSDAFLALGGGTGTATVNVPAVAKNYYNWVSSFTCQNLSTTPTTLNANFVGYTNVTMSKSGGAALNEGDTAQIYVPSVPALPSGKEYAVVVTPNTAGAQIACIVEYSLLVKPVPGDYSTGYNAFNQ